jgi:hypothetical protein
MVRLSALKGTELARRSTTETTGRDAAGKGDAPADLMISCFQSVPEGRRPQGKIGIPGQSIGLHRLKAEIGREPRRTRRERRPAALALDF